MLSGGAVRFALIKGKDALRSMGLQSYSLDAELLMAYALGCEGREGLLSALIEQRELTQEQEAVFEKVLKRRLLYEPISQILGVRDFFLHTFKVTKDVLTPRPETELLIEELLKIFQDTQSRYDFLDLGTGSGCLAITAALLYENSSVTASDISQNALAIASKNAECHNIGSRLKLIQSDWFLSLDLSKRYDAVLCNPPYISSSDWALLEKDVKNYEPSIALTDSKDGLSHYRKIAAQIKKLEVRANFLLFEIGIGQGDAVTEILQSSGYVLERKVADLSGIERCLIFQRHIT